MACVRRRRGKYVVDWRDGAGVRHWKTFDKKTEADAHRDQVGPEARHRVMPTVPASSTVTEYAEYWTRLIRHTVKARTLARYNQLLALHILPRCGRIRVRDLSRGAIKALLADKLEVDLQKRTVRNIQAVLRAMLNGAIEDGLIAANPAAKLGRTLKLSVSKATVREEIKAMTKAQRQHFLATVWKEASRYYSLFSVLAGTGMRLGEALAIQWEDIDYAAKTIRIARAFSEDGTLDTPKSGHGRTVDISRILSGILTEQDCRQKQDKLKYQWTELPRWAFVTKEGTPLDPRNVRRAMYSVLKKANLPLHFSPHCLRHTYASILLAEGVSPVYVQEQLGHATIELTVSTYGRWLKKKAPGALDRLDEMQPAREIVGAHGSKMVADRPEDRSLQISLII